MNAGRSGLKCRATGHERRATNLLYTCSERTTNSTFFLQNEPNFRKTQMNLTDLLTMNYAKWTLGQRGKNEPKTNPIKPNFKGKKCCCV